MADACYLCQRLLNGPEQVKDHLGSAEKRPGKPHRQHVKQRMQASEFLLPLNGASDSAPPWIVGARNAIDMFKPPEARLAHQSYECLTCGHRAKKRNDMIGHLRKEPECAGVAERMRLRRREMASLGQQLTRQGILRSSSTRCGHHGCSQPAILCGFCCGAEHIFCEDHAYCPLCHFGIPTPPSGSMRTAVPTVSANRGRRAVIATVRWKRMKRRSKPHSVGSR